MGILASWITDMPINDDLLNIIKEQKEFFWGTALEIWKSQIIGHRVLISQIGT